MAALQSLRLEGSKRQTTIALQLPKACKAKARCHTGTSQQSSEAGPSHVSADESYEAAQNDSLGLLLQLSPVAKLTSGQVLSDLSVDKLGTVDNDTHTT